jgi:hypothetical protein
MTTLPKPPDAEHLSDEEWDAVVEDATKRAEEIPPMTPGQQADLEASMRNNLRVIWREVDGKKRRCTTFLPIDRDSLNPAFLAALDESKMTVYIRTEPSPFARHVKGPADV